MSIFDTSDKPRIIIAPCSPIVRQHAIVLFSAAQQVLRQRALDEIKRIGDEGDERAAIGSDSRFHHRFGAGGDDAPVRCR